MLVVISIVCVLILSVLCDGLFCVSIVMGVGLNVICYMMLCGR